LDLALGLALTPFFLAAGFLVFFLANLPFCFLTFFLLADLTFVLFLAFEVGLALVVFLTGGDSVFAFGTAMGRLFSNIGGMPGFCWAKPETGTTLRKIAAVNRPKYCCMNALSHFSSWIWHRGGDFPVEFASPVV
jgi:hypothetical protein